MSAEDEVREVAAARDRALIGNDADAIAGYMADEWVYVDGHGATSKAEIIGWIRSGQLRHDVMEATGAERVMVRGDTAVLTSRRRSAGEWDGNGYTVVEWITDVYAREGGEWLCVLSHKTPAE